VKAGSKDEVAVSADVAHQRGKTAWDGRQWASWRPRERQRKQPKKGCQVAETMNSNGGERVVHPACYLHGPVDQLGRIYLHVGVDGGLEIAPAQFHDQADPSRRGHDTKTLHNIFVPDFAQ